MGRARVWSVMVVLGAGLAACGEGESMPLVTERVGEVSEAQGDHNGLSVAALEHNAITANKAALLVLSRFPLTTSTLEGTNPAVAAAYHSMDASTNMGDQLHDAVAQEAMQYVVACALGRDQRVSYHNRFGDNVTFSGGLGICGTQGGATSPVGDWSAAAPTSDCLELVSACLMARTNALGKRIFLSLRGQPSAPSLLPAQLPVFSLAGSVPTQVHYKEGARVASYQACATSRSGVARDCGWTAKSIGRCVAGEVVTIGAGANVTSCSDPLGSASGDTMLRVCRGLYGCDTTTPAYASPYAGMIGQNDDACAGHNPSVQFVCPANGPLVDPADPVTRYGYYSVMMAPHDSASTLSGTETIAVTSGVYPATERQVFSYPEGGFFGNIFQPTQLGAGIATRVLLTGAVADSLVLNPGTDPPVMFKDMHACYADEWTDGVAELTGRMCLASTGTCGIRIAGPCSSRCAILDGPEIVGDGDYHGCRDFTGRSWSKPVTTFLNYPCDLGTPASFGHPATCAITDINGSNVPPQ